MDVLFNMKKWFVAAASVLMTLSLAACGSKTVATTSGGKVTESEYYSSLKKTSSGKQVLQEMILNKILDKEYGDKVTDKKVDAEYNKYKKQSSEFLQKRLLQVLRHIQKYLWHAFLELPKRVPWLLARYPKMLWRCCLHKP